MDKRKGFFSLLLTGQQLELVQARLARTTSEIDSLLNAVLIDPSETNFQSLVNFIEAKLKDKNYFGKITELILSNFDRQFLSIEQTRQLCTLLHQHRNLDDKPMKAMLQFLIDLLEQNIQVSPIYLLNQIETNAFNTQLQAQIITMLQIPSSKQAIAKWKKIMVQLLIVLFDRDPNEQQLRKIAQESPMLRTPECKEQLKSYTQPPVKSPPSEACVGLASASAMPKTSNGADPTVVHREMFRLLSCDDPTSNSYVVDQLQQILVDEKPSSLISLPKFIQALEVVIKKPKKFTQVSLDQWQTLIMRNRGKVSSERDERRRHVCSLLGLHWGETVRSIVDDGCFLSIEHVHWFDGFRLRNDSLETTTGTTRWTEEIAPTLEKHLDQEWRRQGEHSAERRQRIVREFIEHCLRWNLLRSSSPTMFSCGEEFLVVEWRTSTKAPGDLRCQTSEPSTYASNMNPSVKNCFFLC